MQTNGWISVPGFGSSSSYRPCLVEYYADWAPEKLGSVDATLKKYEGREKQMFGQLQKKYGKPANIKRCIPSKKEKA